MLAVCGESPIAIVHWTNLSFSSCKGLVADESTCGARTGVMRFALNMGSSGVDICMSLGPGACRGRPTRSWRPDAEHYNYFRDYDPATGRYLQSDPIGLEAGTTNTFSYVDGNPLTYIDPDGTVIRLITLCGKGFKVVRTVGWKEAVRMARDGRYQLRGDTRKEMKRLGKAASKGKQPIDHKGGHDPFNNPHFHPGPHPGKGGHLFYNFAAGLTLSSYLEGCDCALEKAANIVDLFNPLAVGKDLLDLFGDDE